jgi:hypothetical protein
VFGELCLEVAMGLSKLFQESEWHFELAIAEGADRDGRGGSNPSGDIEPAFCHIVSLPPAGKSLNHQALTLLILSLEKEGPIRDFSFFLSG